MKKLICSIIMVVLMAGTAYAKDLSGRVGLGVGTNWFYYLPSEDDFDGDDLDLKGTPEAVNVHISYCLPNPSETVNVSFIFDWERIVRDIETEKSYGLSKDLGTLTMMPLMVGVQVRAAGSGPVTPYMGFSMGISINSVDEGDRARDFERSWESAYPGYRFEADIDVENSFALKVPIGMDIFLSDNIALNLEGKYFYTNPEFEAKATYFSGAYSESVKDDLNQGTFAFGGGINFYF